MVGAMAKLVQRSEDNDLVLKAKTQAEALGRLYEMYYERIFRFCVYRLFNKEIAEDVPVKKPITDRFRRRNIMFKDEADFEKVVGRLNIDTEPNPAHRENLRQQMLSVFNETTQQSQKPATPFGVFRRTIMKNKTAQLTIAASIVIGAFICFSEFGSLPHGTSVAFGQVIAYLRNAETVSFRMTIEQEGQEPQTTYCWTMEPNHQRIEMEDGSVVIVDTFQGKSIALDPAGKKAYLMETVVAPKEILNYYDYIKKDLLENVLDGSQENLGETEIDGQKVVGFHVRRNDCEITVWASTANSMPVMIQSERVSHSETDKDQKGQATTVTITDIVIGEELDESLFSLSPPKGFSAIITSESDVKPQRQVMQVLSARVMRNLTMACLKYSQEHDGVWPENLHQAIEYGGQEDNLSNLADPERELGCVYVRPSQTNPRLVLLYQAYDVWPEGGIIVSFVDSYTTVITDETAFKKHLEYTLAQQNDH